MISNDLHKKIERLKVADDVFEDLTKMWEQSQADMQREIAILKKMSDYHRIRAYLSSKIIEQVEKENLATLKQKTKLSNTQYVDAAHELIDWLHGYPEIIDVKRGE